MTADDRARDEQVMDARYDGAEAVDATISHDGAAPDGAAHDGAVPDDPSSTAEYEPLIEFLRRTRNFDLAGYKRAGLLRRLTKRMRTVGVRDVPGYIAHLETHPDEFAQLLDTLLINVTAFFRDDLPWEYLSGEVLPRLMERRGATESIRVWSAGCATGQEAYTLAMVLAECLGADGFRERVKIYATDLDDGALQKARHGVYSEAELADVPEAMRERYFEPQHDGRWAFRRDFRRQVIFGRNDLLQDAPISRIDLLACRNTLMYFDSETQAKILARFHFALNDGGVLLLGRAETLLTHNAHFAPLDLRRRVFVKVPRALERDRQFIVPRLLAPTAPPAGDASGRSLRELAFDASTVAQFVVDREGRLAMANTRARTLFGLSATDVGRPLQDLKVSYLPLELRSVIDQAYMEMRTITRTDVAWRSPSGDPRWFEIMVAPLRGGSQPDGASISFVDSTRARLLLQQVEESQAELEAAYQELQSTNEELETTNEELHSTVEELETTNEELQSTNEELETMNEELQSTNEELQTINDEHRLRGDEFNRVNGFLDAVLTSVRFGVVVLDRELRVLVWNDRAENLWGMRMDEVEHMHFLNLDIGLPVARLVEPLRAALAGGESVWEAVLPSTNRRGRAIECRVTVMPLVRRGDERPQGVIVLMHEQPAASASDEAAPR